METIVSFHIQNISNSKAERNTVPLVGSYLHVGGKGNGKCACACVIQKEGRLFMLWDKL